MILISHHAHRSSSDLVEIRQSRLVTVGQLNAAFPCLSCECGRCDHFKTQGIGVKEYNAKYWLSTGTYRECFQCLSLQFCKFVSKMAPSAVEIPIAIPKAFSTPNKAVEPVEKADLKSPESPLPEVKSFDATTCSVEDLVAALRVAGGVVVRGVLNTEELVKLEKDTRPWLDKDEPWGEGGGEGRVQLYKTLILLLVLIYNRRLLPTRDSSSIWHGHQI